LVPDVSSFTVCAPAGSIIISSAVKAENIIL
jgi:hypothetical protein